eukprot:scaffold112258_cov57-Phaeocystis_antarctica.AAC.3
MAISPELIRCVPPPRFIPIGICARGEGLQAQRAGRALNGAAPTCLPSGIGHLRPQHGSVDAAAACRAHHPAVPCHRRLQRWPGLVCSRSAGLDFSTLKQSHLAAVGRIHGPPHRRAPLHDRRHGSGLCRVVLALGSDRIRRRSRAGCRRHRALAERDASRRAATVGLSLLTLHPEAPGPCHHRPPHWPAGHGGASVRRADLLGHVLPRLGGALQHPAAADRHARARAGSRSRGRRARHHGAPPACVARCDLALLLRLLPARPRHRLHRRHGARPVPRHPLRAARRGRAAGAAPRLPGPRHRLQRADALLVRRGGGQGVGDRHVGLGRLFG